MSPGWLSGWSTAMSFAGVDDTTWAVVWLPSAKVTWMVEAPSITWLAVMIWPAELMTTPLPMAESALAGAPGLVWMKTSDGSIFL